MNAASDQADWGAIDLVRRYPFLAIALIVAATVVLIILTVLRDRETSDPASTDDLEDAERRLTHSITQAAPDAIARKMSRLPSTSRLIIEEIAEHDRPSIWRIISPFTDDNVEPSLLAREWAVSPPAALSDLSANGLLAVAETLAAYGEFRAALVQLNRALLLGATPRPFWLVRRTQLLWNADGEQSTEAALSLAEALQVDPSYPLAMALTCARSGKWDDAEQVLDGWTPAHHWERDTALLAKVTVLVNQGRNDSAITALQEVAPETEGAGLLLELAKLLRARSIRGGGDSRWKDATTAVEWAVRARNLRRSWRGDSAQAVQIAAEAAMTAGDHQQVWRLTSPAPEGEATPAEAADTRVLPLAAVGAALSGRIEQAKQLAQKAPDGFIRKRMEAEIASSTNPDSETSARAWAEALPFAVSDEDQLYVLRGMAMEGATDGEAFDRLRPRYPELIEDLERMAEVASVTGHDADQRLREQEHATPLASVRRAELLRRDNPERAAEILTEANDRWNDPQMLLLAVDCLMEAGVWDKAADLAQQALLTSGTLWAGRRTILRRLLVIEQGRQNWPMLVTTSRALLEIDDTDDDARWHLALAQYRNGEPRDAWNTLNRVGATTAAATPDRAVLLLELLRRYAEAKQVAQTGLTILRAHPDDLQVHAAVMHAITMRADRADLPEELGTEVTAAWELFFTRYPDNKIFVKHQIHDDSNPLAMLEPQLKRQAETYKEISESVEKQTLPIGLIDRIVSKPYAAIFPYRPFGYHRAASASNSDQEIERALARDELNRPCIIDASALYTLALIPDFAQTLLTHAGRLTVTDAGLNDLIAAEDHFNMPSSATTTFDAQTGRVIAVKADLSVTERQQAQIRHMLTTARAFRKISHPALLHLESWDEAREPVWLLTLDAAKEIGATLWADDLGLRRLAHSLGVPTFGTDSILHLAHNRDRITDNQNGQILRTFTSEYVVDLPLNTDVLLAVAAEQKWHAPSVALVLSRPYAWAHLATTAGLFIMALQHAPEEAQMMWTSSAITGLQLASPPDHRGENLIALVSAALFSAQTRPDHAKALVAGLMQAAADDADEITRAALERVWRQLKESYGQRADLVLLHILSQLDPAYSQYGVSLILQK